ncbi:MAG: aspartate 1-decarboxylase [Minisyncoccia bacterium]
MGMKIPMCLAKIHRAIVTGAKLDYVGSITIDQDLIDAAGFLPNQQVRINSVANGTSWETYIVPGERGKGEIILNGPPAHFFKAGDIVIILAYVHVGLEDAKRMTHPQVVFVNDENHITSVEDAWRPYLGC